MPKSSTAWTVLPHQPIEKLASNLWRVTGALPKMPLERAMTAARARDGRLFIHNAMALEEDAMQELEAWGNPAFLVVPSGFHRMDCARFAQRYPGAKVVCPAGSRKRVEQAVAVDTTYGEVAGDDSVQIEHLDGVKQREGVMQVRSDDGITLVFNDLLFNVAHMAGVQGLILRVMGVSGGPRVDWLARLLLVADKAAVRAHLLRLADTPDLVRIVPGHGDVITGDAAAALRQVAARL